MGAGIRALREEEAREMEVAEEAKAEGMWSASIAGSSATIKGTVRTSPCVTTAGERATNRTTAHTPRKMDRTHHHRLGKQRAKEKG